MVIEYLLIFLPETNESSNLAKQTISNSSFSHMEAVDLIYEPSKKFISNCKRVLKRCTLPSAKTIKRTAIATGVGFTILGTIGFLFKVVSIPINNALISGIARK